MADLKERMYTYPEVTQIVLLSHQSPPKVDLNDPRIVAASLVNTNTTTHTARALINGDTEALARPLEPPANINGTYTSSPGHS